MKQAFFILSMMCTVIVNAQVFTPKWAVLDKGNTVGIVKPGANDMMTYLGTHLKNMSREAFAEINEEINYVPGSAVLVYDKVGELYLAGDLEGRTLMIKGPVTFAEQKEGSGLGYIRENVTEGDIFIPKGTYVWLKKRNTKQAAYTVQYAGNRSITLPESNLFIINQTTAELEPSVKFKPVR
jgi:hypothetical protein